MRRMESRISRIHPIVLISVLFLGVFTSCTGCMSRMESADKAYVSSMESLNDSKNEKEDSETRMAVEDEQVLNTEKNVDTESEEITHDDDSEEALWVTHTLEDMTLEEKVSQMFMVTPETITGCTKVTAAGNTTEQSLKRYPVGGIIYFASNLQNASQTSTMLKDTAEYARENHDIPIFLAVDEEGGRVARIARNSSFSVEQVPAMREIGDSKDSSKAYEAGNTIGRYLSELGFNLDFAPDADVLTNSSNTVIGDRSFGTDAEIVSDMMLEMADGLLDNDVIPCVKHFPGHGCTQGDTHQGLAYTDRTMKELRSCELVPFQTAVDNGLPMIMVSHISVPSVTGDDTPASLSHYLVTDLLRGQMGYDGIVITDAMGMGAIADNYECGEAAVLALEAGCDMLLVTADFSVAYKAVLAAVSDGRISEQQIDTSVERILRIKYSLK